MLCGNVFAIQIQFKLVGSAKHYGKGWIFSDVVFYIENYLLSGNMLVILALLNAQLHKGNVRE